MHLLLLLLLAPGGSSPEGVRVSAVEPAEVDAWEARLEALVRDGRLAPRSVREDTLLPGRRHERFAQIHRGVPVFGGELVRQVRGDVTVSIFGTLYEGIDVDPRPAVSGENAGGVVQARTGARPPDPPELGVFHRRDGGYALIWRVRLYANADVRIWYVDARTGAVLFDRSDLQTDAAVGLGTGVLGDRKKVSTTAQGGTFLASDALRPPSIRTFDMKGNVSRTIYFLLGQLDVDDSDLARDADDVWSDGANVDGHVHAGWVYDYYFKRFGRRGLDDADVPIRGFVHPVNREELFGYQDNIVQLFYLNAAYFGNGVMVYGEGLPPNLVDSEGRHWNYVSGGLDVVGHELTHGVTQYSSSLDYADEPGALNEAFSDIMGTSVEFYFQPPGNGPLMADYLIGEDVITPGGLRSMAHPADYGDPDHYSQRYLGPRDNGGVHINSAIPNQAFYLAIEGGVNATSHLAVEGVGAAHRDQIEKAFYRAFTQMLPTTANFAVARAATLQSARDLYGAGSAPERAVAQAWTAVGVE